MIGLVTDWFQYFQINEIFKRDKEKGFVEGGSEFEKIILGNNKKIIMKVYRTLLEWETKDESVKEAMIHWA